MEIWSQSLFDMVLMSSVERLFERATTRFEGEEAALAKLKSPDDSLAQLVESFVSAIFNDFGIGDSAGACFILKALDRQMVTVKGFEGTLGDLLLGMAKVAFSEILVRKTIEAAELSMSYDFRAAQF